MKGLNSKQVLESRQKYGSNKLPEPKLKKWYNFAADALKEPITMILIAIALLQIVLGFLGVMEFTDPVMIMFVLTIVTAIAVKTGLGVQKAAKELRDKTSVRYCNVIRDGKIQRINKNEIVVDDIVCVETGQEIFADGYIIEGKISVNNAAINGETKECKKTPVSGYKHVKTTSTDAYTNQNCLFAGTIVMSGEGKMMVTDVGINTVNGDTLVKMQTLEAPKTALDIALENLSGFISKWGTIAAAITFIILSVSGIIQAGGISQYFAINILETIQKLAQNFSIALTIVVAAVPEGLPLIVKLVTKQNVKTMERSNILAKNPNKIPETAYLNIICTDKTGTLTTGVMTPKKIINGEGQEIGNDIYAIRTNTCLNNSAMYDSNGNITGGNSIDRAVLGLSTYEEYKEIVEAGKIKAKQVFSSSNKYSAVTTIDGESYYKGAPEKLINKCTKYLINDEEVDFTEEKREKLDSAIRSMTENAMRCIALTYHDAELVEDTLPEDMTLLGVIGVVDPVRAEVPDAVKKAHEAGIQVIEITGDCIETAVAVAKECGIYKDGDTALTNDEFEKLTDEEVKSIIPSLRVISRCSPNTKLRLVTLIQGLGLSVAMTGDGVNDSPALKKADVGFGMQTGSDVAKEASDIVLTDDNFTSVVKAVELGRTFMHNIMMFLEFQLPINISLLILSMLYPIVAGTALLASVQILIVNIIMDSLNSLSFGGEPPKDEYMREKPIKKGSGLFIRGAKGRIALSSAVFVFLYMILTITPLKNCFSTEVEAMTARFALLCFMAVFNGFNIRTDRLNLFKGISRNKLFVYIALGIFAMTVLLCNVVGSLIQTTALDINHWMIVIVLALTVIPVDLIRKIFIKGKK